MSYNDNKHTTADSEKVIVERLQKNFIDQAKIIKFEQIINQHQDVKVTSSEPGHKPKRPASTSKRPKLKPNFKMFNIQKNPVLNAKVMEKIAKKPRSNRHSQINQKIVERIFSSQRKKKQLNLENYRSPSSRLARNKKKSNMFKEYFPPLARVKNDVRKGRQSKSRAYLHEVKKRRISVDFKLLDKNARAIFKNDRVRNSKMPRREHRSVDYKLKRPNFAIENNFLQKQLFPFSKVKLINKPKRKMSAGSEENQRVLMTPKPIVKKKFSMSRKTSPKIIPVRLSPPMGNSPREYNRKRTPMKIGQGQKQRFQKLKILKPFLQSNNSDSPNEQIPPAVQ